MLTTAELMFALTAAAAGALVHGSIGFGFSLVVAPAMVLTYPDAVPATILCLTLPLTASMAIREWRSIDLTGFAWITAGRVIGTVFGLWLLLFLSESLLSKMFGSLILVSVVVSVLSHPSVVRRGHRFVGGVVSGTMSTTAALGGPPLALVYQRSSGAKLRSTLSFSFAIGIVMSLFVLAVAGQVKPTHLVLAIQMAPGMLVGFMGSTVAARYLDGRYLRTSVLAFASAAGFAILFTG